MNTKTYTRWTAGMTLGTARDVLARPEAGWTADQRARAHAVVRYWNRRQSSRITKPAK